MTLRDILLEEILNLTARNRVIITRTNSDYQVRLSDRGLAYLEMRYIVGNLPECPWFSFEGFSAEDVIADDWKIA